MSALFKAKVLQHNLDGTHVRVDSIETDSLKEWLQWMTIQSDKLMTGVWSAAAKAYSLRPNGTTNDILFIRSDDGTVTSHPVFAEGEY